MPLNVTNIRVSLKVNDIEFTLFSQDGYLLIDSGNDQVASYCMVVSDVNVVAQDLPSRIAYRLAKPHMVFQDDKELLKFYLDMMNIVNMFYLHEFTTEQ